MTPDLRSLLATALADGAAGASSDFDLNPGTARAGGHPLRPAGVLVPVVPGPGGGAEGARVILTKRASTLKHHPGQVAFPGGKVDPGDDGPVGAALREAGEEIGLPRGAVTVLGTLPVHETVTGFTVTPAVGLVTAPFAPVPEAGEVDEVFEVPFQYLSRPESYAIEGRMWRGTLRRYYVAAWGPYYIWGATARILRGLAERLAHADRG